MAAARSRDFIHRQYVDVCEKFDLEVDYVRSVVDNWVHQRPVARLYKARRPGCFDFISFARSVGMKVATVSDYPSKTKIEALELPIDVHISSTDVSVGRLKPDPAGLVVASERLSVPIDGCLMIGDRDERDGAAAREIGMPYLIYSSSGTENSFSSFAALHAELMAFKHEGRGIK